MPTREEWWKCNIEQEPRSLGERIKHYRILAGLTQRELGADCGLQSRYVSNLECGNKANPCLSTLTRIANNLGVSLDMLVNDHDLLTNPASQIHLLRRLSLYLNANPKYLRVVEEFAAYILDNPGTADARRLYRYLKSSKLAKRSKTA